MKLGPETLLSHYRILSKIGEGGMGEVYLAEDDVLERKVALKVLSEQCCRESDRLQRFIREAKASSALNHPNIITIFEFGAFDDTHFIASELIEGRTVGSILESGPLETAAALRIATQVASALEAAHSAGIVHRDIKPDNVMVRPDGIVKVLDFGVAKLLEHKRAVPSSSEDATRIRIDTSPGMIIGTANYMSPEQAAGKEIDARSDIFSFGVLVYEMLSGSLPFQGGTPVEIIGAVLYKEAKPLGETAPDAPEEVCSIVSKAMQKDPADRYQDIGELLDDLREITGESAGGVAGVSGTGTSKPEAATRILDASSTGDPAVPDTVRQTVGEKTKRSTLVSSPLIAVAAVVLAAITIGAGIWYFAGSGAKQIESIAVMPFVNESSDQDAEYLSDGMTDTLISSLSQIQNLNVKARSSVFRFKGMNTGVGEIGNELNVQAVLNGRVTTRNDQVSLSLELVDVATENIIWSQKYDRTQKDLIALQNEIARDVLTRIRSTLTGNSSKAGSEIRTEDPEAYTAYLKGLYHFNKRERNDYLKALEYFRKAVQLDPDYALAYVGISSATALAEREDIHTDTRRKEAFEALERAKSLAPDSSEVHAGLANHYFFWKMEWEKAEPEYREAISLNPNYSTAHHWYGEALCYLGRFEECFPHFQRALEIDPLSLAIISDLGRAYYFAGRYDDARKQLEKGIDLDPDFSRSYEYLSMVYEASGEYEKAAEQIEKRESREYEAAAAEQKKTELVQAFRASGPKGYWQKRLEWKLKEDRARNNSSYWQLADIFAKLGEKDKAFEQLELALEYKWYVAPTLWVDPALDPLRSDPRFEALLTKTGLFKSAQNKRK